MRRLRNLLSPKVVPRFHGDAIFLKRGLVNLGIGKGPPSEPKCYPIRRTPYLPTDPEVKRAHQFTQRLLGSQKQFRLWNCNQTKRARPLNVCLGIPPLNVCLGIPKTVYRLVSSTQICWFGCFLKPTMRQVSVTFGRDTEALLSIVRQTEG